MPNERAQVRIWAIFFALLRYYITEHMRASFQFRLVNDPFGDPALFVRPTREKHGYLFDLGDISGLTSAERNIVTDVFVTHTHVDHFIGFDLLLRSLLRRQGPIRLYGPPPLTRCVYGKLRGYAWNLIEEYPTEIEVFEFNGRTLRRSCFRAQNRFRQEKYPATRSDGLLLEDCTVRISAIRLWHGIPCLAYSLQEPCAINIDKDMLIKKGFRVGPWLNELKRLFRDKSLRPRTVQVQGRTIPISKLTGILRISRGLKITYATDIAMTAENARRLIGFSRDSDLLFCEAYFLEKDRKLALGRQHLTARACGEIARGAGVRKLVPFHFSPKYRETREAVENEAIEAFAGDGRNNADATGSS